MVLQPDSNRLADASVVRRWSAEGGADHRRLGGFGKEVVLSCDEQDLPAGRLLKPADVLQHQALARESAHEPEASHRGGEIVGALDGCKGLLKHAAIDHCLARHRVREGTRAGVLCMSYRDSRTSNAERSAHILVRLDRMGWNRLPPATTPQDTRAGRGAKGLQCRMFPAGVSGIPGRP